MGTSVYRPGVCPAVLDGKCQAFQSNANFGILGHLSLAKNYLKPDLDAPIFCRFILT